MHRPASWIAIALIAVAAVCVSSPNLFSDDKEEDKSPDVVYVPTPHDVVSKMLDMVKVTKDDLSGL